MSKNVYGMIKLGAGLIIVMIGFGMFVGGGATMLVSVALTDEAGYFQSTDLQIVEPNVSAVRFDLPIKDHGPSLEFDLSNIVKLRLRGSAAGSPVVAGLVTRAEADALLANTSYYQLTDVNFGFVHEEWHQESYYSGFKVAARNETPNEPQNWIMGGYDGKEFYWSPSTNDLRSDLSLVIMVTEPTDNLDVTASVGAHVPILMPIGFILLIVGAFILMLGILLVTSGIGSLTAKEEVVYVTSYADRIRGEGPPKARVVDRSTQPAQQVSYARPLNQPSESEREKTVEQGAEVVDARYPRYCSQCGLLNEPDSRFCPECGSNLK